MRPPPLSGVRVIDLTSIAAGPYCTSLLGDLGADVITVEPPGGEPFRSIDNMFGPGESAYHFGINRSKRSIALDLAAAEGREVLDRLVRTADVCAVAFRVSAVRKLGLEAERLLELNPRLVYCSLTAFGETGPRADEPGMDILAQALGATMGLTGEPEGPPIKVGPPIADFAVSFLAGFAICAALRARDRDGVGQKIALNLLDGQLACNANFVTPFLRSGVPIRPAGGGHPQLVPYQAFAAADGYMVVACLNDRFWPPLCRAIGRDDLIDDPTYRTNGDRVRNRERLVPLLEELFASAPARHWLEALGAEGVPCSPVNRLEDAIADPQVVHNGTVTELEHPRHGPYGVVAPPFRFEGTEVGVAAPVADLGQHTDEVLEELGYDGAGRARLRELGVV